MATNSAGNIPTGASGTVLRGQGVGTASAFSSSTYPATNSQGDIIYGSASNVISALAKNTTATRYLANTGTSNSPAWDQVNIANGVTGTLPLANGGTNATSMATSTGIVKYDGTRLVTSTATIDSSNRYVNGSQPAVFACLTTGTTNVTGDGTNVGPLIFDSVISNQGSEYNTGTGIYTASVTGYYFFYVQVTFNNLAAGHTGGHLIINTPLSGNAKSNFNPGALRTSIDLTSAASFCTCMVAKLAAGAQVTVTAAVSGSTKTVGIQGSSSGNYTFLNAFLMC